MDKDKCSFNDILLSVEEDENNKSLYNQDEIIIESNSNEINNEPEEKNIINTNPINNNLIETDDTLAEKENIKGESNDINNQKQINSIIKFFNNKKVYTILIILIFILSCILVGKTFYLRNKVDNYEELIITVNKEESEIKTYSDKTSNINNIKKGAASELINCLNNPIEIDELPENIIKTINDINNFYNSSNDYFAFVYKDIFTGFTVSYNENQNIFTASAIKGPTDIYIYEMTSLGKINLDEELTYTSNYYNTGSGLLKSKEFNTKYTVRKLLEYSTVYSDNAAHNMLTDRFGRKNMYDFWKEKGTTAIFSQNTNWGVLNAKDCSIYMNELYDFYTRDKEYGTAIMNNFMNAIPKFISSENNYAIANKSGWSGSVLHDIAIVFADNPYVLVALSNTGVSGNYMNYFNTISSLTNKLHTEYWQYKMNMCENIKQY